MSIECVRDAGSGHEPAMHLHTLAYTYNLLCYILVYIQGTLMMIMS